MASIRKEVAARAFTEEMHKGFALLSGDWNPMHMDALAARRTQAGERVVHGVHTLLWSLESLLAAELITSPVSRVKAKFLKWVYLGDSAALTVADDATTNPANIQVEVHGLPVLTVELEYRDASLARQASYTCELKPLTAAQNLSFADLQGRRGEAYVASAEDVRLLFPRLADKLGARAVAEIAACSYIVGMETPGLHSTFSKLDLTFHTGPECAGLAYEVSYHDERFRKARIRVTGRESEGTLEVFARVPPVPQATVEDVASVIDGQEFAGMRALIIGGSRGLGEATAKIIAAGGGDVVISYATGKGDAERLAEEIRLWGGSAETFQYDVRNDPRPQLSALGNAPTHLFYFATNAIFKPKYELMSQWILAEFLQFYVHGFHDLCKALTDAPDAAAKLIVYYPSSVAVEERPAGMTEYSMAKAAGELLCTDMNLYLPELHVLVSRLPRLPTDQTAGILPGREVNPLDTLIPLVREMKRLGASGE